MLPDDEALASSSIEAVEARHLDVPLSLTLLMPLGVQAEVARPWNLVAYNKRVLSSWNSLAANTPANARNCYEWLSQHATRIKPRRCYPLKGRAYAGVWAYEIGSGDRVYYRPNEEAKKATIYYAGQHPPRIPEPPDDL